MSSAPDPQLQRALTALRALEPPSNGFEARLRGSLLQAAADPALFPRRAPVPARPVPARPSLVRRWRQRPLAALSLAALSLAAVAAAVSGRDWLRQRDAVAPVLGAEPSSAPAARTAAPEPVPPRDVPKVLESPPVSEPAPSRPVLPPQAERVSRPEPVRAHRPAPLRDPSSSSAPALPLRQPERAPAAPVLPRFDLPDLPAAGSERSSAPRVERSTPRADRVPSPDDRSRALDRSSEARDRAERRRQLERPRPILDPPALDRDRRGPSEVREREHEREQPEPHESEGSRDRR